MISTPPSSPRAQGPLLRPRPTWGPGPSRSAYSSGEIRPSSPGATWDRGRRPIDDRDDPALPLTASRAPPLLLAGNWPERSNEESCPGARATTNDTASLPLGPASDRMVTSPHGLSLLIRPEDQGKLRRTRASSHPSMALWPSSPTETSAQPPAPNDGDLGSSTHRESPLRRASVTRGPSPPPPPPCRSRIAGISIPSGPHREPLAWISWTWHRPQACRTKSSVDKAGPPRITRRSWAPYPDPGLHRRHIR